MSNVYLKVLNQSQIGFALFEIIFLNGDYNFQLKEANEKFLEVVGTNFSLNNYENLQNKCITYYNLKKDGEIEVLIFNKGFVKFKIIYLDEITLALSILSFSPLEKFDKNFFYEQIIKSMNDLVWIMDADFNFQYISPSVQNVIGYSESELVGKNLKDVVSIKNLKKAISIKKEAIINPTKETFNVYIDQTHKTGKKVYIDYNIKFIRNQDNEIVSMMGVGRDITAWVISQEELKESKENLSLISNSTAEGIFGVNKDGIITFVNNSCISLLGYSNENELIGKHVKVIMGIDNDEQFFKVRFSKVLEDGIGYTHEIDQFVKRDGSSFVAEYNIFPQTTNKEIIGCVITFIDITEKIKIENELYESERSKSVFLANLPGLAFSSAYTDDYPMHFVSDGCYELTGYLPEQLLNNRDVKFIDIIVPRDKERVKRKLRELAYNTGKFQDEYEIICADGSTKWVFEQSQLVYNQQGQIVALEGLIIDISDLKKKQAEIEYLLAHDSLTGLKNRLSYDKAKQKYYREEYLPVSLIVGDINGLKLINDAIGHNEGDKMLIETARLLLEVIKDRDLIFRTSGDEFTILLPNTDSVKANETLKAILKHIDKYNEKIDNDLFKINLALGFATLEKLDRDFKDIAKVAEEYMYKRKLNDRKSSYSTIISYIRSTMYERSQVTEEHAERMKYYTQLLGQAMNLSQVELDELTLLSTLHDVGKVGIDDRILKKPGPLTEDEWIEMRKHPEIGYRICMASPELMSIAPYVLSHHERWDGKGYPRGLKGEEIPLLARIISVVDAYDAMTEDRVYRKGISKDAALQEIELNAGTQFDPKIAKIFVNLMRKQKSC